MADEEVVLASTASPVPADHKRKLHDFETEPGSEPAQGLALDTSTAADNDSDDKADPEADADSPDAKRARLDDEKPDDGIASENGHQTEKIEEPAKESDEQAPDEDNDQKEVEPQMKEQETVEDQPSRPDNLETGDSVQPSIENVETEISEEPSKVEAEQPSVGTPQEVDAQDPQEVDAQDEPDSQKESTSRKMEVPNNKVGVLIGKAGDTIRLLQYNSGAKIQITRDADADPDSATRSVELIGTPDNINKAEKLIKDVIAEADAGGSPSLVARGIASAQATGVAEQFLMPVPNEKVGLIIGRAGETIKGLQTRSGARIQLIPQRLPEGDESKERTVRVTGDKRQIEVARELIGEVMNQTVRASPLSGNYNQQSYKPRGPGGPPQWGPRGPHPSAYDYQQRGPYPSSNPQYPPSAYGGYPSQQMGPRSSFGSGWEQRPPSSMHGPPQGGGYDYYGGQAGNGPHSAHHSSAPAMGPPQSYNYGQQQGPDYGHPAPYSQTAPQQPYGHGYDEPNQAQAQHYATSQPGYQGNQLGYQGNQPGYASQQQYAKPQPYGMPAQGPAPQSFGPRASQPGDVPYQGPAAAQPYGQNVAPQQSYPYASSGPTQQTYPPYGSAPTATADGYNQQPPTSGSGYPQQGGQPIQGYNQASGQQATGYGQVGPTGGYGQYAATQGYTEQPAANNAGYGYQAPQDPAYNSSTGYGAPAGGHTGYAQPVPAQPGYDHSVPPQSGGYGSAPAAGYVKASSPQPGYPPYDATQMYGAPR